MPIVFDHSRGNLIVVTFTGSPSDAEFDAYLATMEERLHNPAPCVYVMDARGTVNSTNAQIRRQGLWTKTHHARIFAICKGTAFVFDSPALRFVLSSVFLIHRPPTAYVVTRDLQDALTWARGMLEAL